MPGANYLSGGQSLADAAARLSALNKFAKSSGGCPWNLSFSWSAALQFPLFDLCEGKGELQLEEMSKLYKKELEIASKAANGEHTWKKGEGDHVGKKVDVDVEIKPIEDEAVASFVPKEETSSTSGGFFSNLFK